MSPRAAARLGTLGFGDVYDYVDGKVDWLAAALPSVRAPELRPSAAELARADVPTCGLGDDLSRVRERVRELGWELCVVVDEHGVVLGRLGRRALAGTDATTVEAAMTAGPSTIRPHVPGRDVRERMLEHDLTTQIVTTSDGRLVGVVRRADVDA